MLMCTLLTFAMCADPNVPAEITMSGLPVPIVWTHVAQRSCTDVGQASTTDGAGLTHYRATLWHELGHVRTALATVDAINDDGDFTAPTPEPFRRVIPSLSRDSRNVTRGHSASHTTYGPRASEGALARAFCLKSALTCARNQCHPEPVEGPRPRCAIMAAPRQARDDSPERLVSLKKTPLARVRSSCADPPAERWRNTSTS